MAVLLAGEILAWAAARVGRKEIPVGSNDAPWLRTDLGPIGFHPGDEWCLQFAMAAWYHAAAAHGLEVDFLDMSGNCQSFLATNRAAGRVYTDVSRGSIMVLLNSAGRAFHAGLCDGAADTKGLFLSIEGNTDAPGNPEADEVWRHTRIVADCRFIVPGLRFPGRPVFPGDDFGVLDEAARSGVGPAKVVATVDNLRLLGLFPIVSNRAGGLLWPSWAGQGVI